MSKAILVIDMPDSCRECPLELVKCQCAVNSELMKDNTIRQNWCPLRPMPEKKEVCGKYPQPDGITPSYKIGYNACVDELGGGANETDKETHQSP